MTQGWLRIRCDVRSSSIVGAGRRIPGWAAGLVDGLARDAPYVVTRDDVAHRLLEAGSGRNVDSTVSELRRLGWLVGLPVHGVWAFIPPGHDEPAGQYVALRGWVARDRPGLLLAGANAAWHLGYLDRQPSGRTQVWLAGGVRLPDGLRPHVSVVALAGAFGRERLVFDGGTSLRKCRLGNDGRFSTELDFAAPDDDVVLDVCELIHGSRVAGSPSCPRSSATVAA
jgi:hypothetical protein